MFFFANENEGWAVGQTNTILHTSDGGDNWEQQTVTPSSNYASVFFIDEMEGWAVGSLGKIVHTIDGGVNWETQSANVYESLSEVIFIDCDHGWIAGGRAAGYPGPDPARYVLHTSDGGENWETQYYESNNSSWSFSGLDIVDSTYGWAVGFSGAIVRRQGVTFRPQSEIVP
ncbi:MAG: hypothetical protein K9N07_10720, partial [Candidatus Cloacimonetes bacterium]|nr:hypothetical protein [Candidatus Cloacimonadota bacterium]